MNRDLGGGVGVANECEGWGSGDGSEEGKKIGINTSLTTESNNNNNNNITIDAQLYVSK